MLAADRTTLTQFMIGERRRFPSASGDFNGLILNVALACKAISRSVALGALGDIIGDSEVVSGQGGMQRKLGVISNDAFIRINERSGYLAGMLSATTESLTPIPRIYPKGKYLLAFDPLDGASNIDVDVAVGSIFSVLRAQNVGADAEASDFLQCGTAQVAAGYAIYGPTTMLVLTVGNGVNGFTLDPHLGEFILTHADLRVPEDTQEFAIDASNSRFWERPVKRYVDECLAGTTGPRGRDFNMRWIASIVAETHRILMRGGVFMYPRDSKDSVEPTRLRLLYEANPLGLIVEQAGGRASTGRGRVLEEVPVSLRHGIGFVFGSKNEVERIERYHSEPEDSDAPAPLFNERSLFRLRA